MCNIFLCSFLCDFFFITSIIFRPVRLMWWQDETTRTTNLTAESYSTTAECDPATTKSAILSTEGQPNRTACHQTSHQSTDRLGDNFVVLSFPSFSCCCWYAVGRQIAYPQITTPSYYAWYNNKNAFHLFNIIACLRKSMRYIASTG